MPVPSIGGVTFDSNVPAQQTGRISKKQRMKNGKEHNLSFFSSIRTQSARTALQVPPAPPTTLLLVLSARMTFFLSAPLFILSAPLPHSRLLRMALPAGLHSAPGVFCPDFSLAAGAEKARLFRISMTMACNAVTGVAGRPPAKFLVSATSNKLSRQGGTQSWSSKRK